MLYEVEKHIMAILKHIGADKDEALGIIILLSDPKGEYSREECGEKLLKYFMAKGKYLTVQDALSKAMQICRDREQYLPFNMYVKYIGNTNDELINGDYYQVGVSYDNDCAFVIINELDEKKEYDAELFEICDVSEVEYIGEEKEDGTIEAAEGFEIGKFYEVSTFKTGKYICKNGKECWFFECAPSKFKSSAPKEIPPFRFQDGALNLMRRVLEFGCFSEFEERLAHDCTFICESANAEMSNAKTIIEYLKTEINRQLKRDIYFDCAFATVKWSASGNRFGVGSRCLVVYNNEKIETLAFVVEDKGIIKGIYLLDEEYEFELDEP